MLLSLALFAACTPADDVDVPVASDDSDACGIRHTWEENETPAAIADGFQTAFDAADLEGAVWAILIDGEIKYAGAHGYRDVENDLPMEVTTLLRTGWTLKMQTATAVLHQEGLGRLTRDDTVGDWIPEYVENSGDLVGAEATVHDLLTHQGGFRDTWREGGHNEDEFLYEYTVGGFARGLGPLVAPGTFYNYANPNYSLAGLIAELAADTPYRQLIDETVWTPLCMDRTYFGPDAVLDDGNFARSWGVDSGTGEVVRVGPRGYDNAFSAPAGMAWSNVVDMLRFADFLLEGNEEVLPSDLWEAQTHSQVDTLLYPPSSPLDYGYGLLLTPDWADAGQWYDAPIWSHDGFVDGYIAGLYIHPDSRVAIATLSNSENPGADLAFGVGAAMKELTDDAVKDAPDFSVDPSTFSQFEGTYYYPYPFPGDLTVTVEDDTLVVDAPGLDGLEYLYERELEPFTPNNFYFTIQGRQTLITFIPDGETGEMRWIRSRGFVCDKNPPESSRMEAGPQPDALVPDHRWQPTRPLASF